jgi:hypothetical protein
MEDSEFELDVAREGDVLDLNPDDAARRRNPPRVVFSKSERASLGRGTGSEVLLDPSDGLPYLSDPVKRKAKATNALALSVFNLENCLFVCLGAPGR